MGMIYGRDFDDYGRDEHYDPGEAADRWYDRYRDALMEGEEWAVQYKAAMDARMARAGRTAPEGGDRPGKTDRPSQGKLGPLEGNGD